MAGKTKIEWATHTWNPVTGCTQISPGCANCYALTFAERWRGVRGHHFEYGFDVTLRPEMLAIPMRWVKPREIFVNSMSDMFHEAIEDAFIHATLQTMILAPQHRYMVLTKRPERMRELLSDPELPDGLWDHADRAYHGEYGRLYPRGTSDPCQQPNRGRWPLENLGLGVSTESQRWALNRIPLLKATPACMRFVSAEPLLNTVDLEVKPGAIVAVGLDARGEPTAKPPVFRLQGRLIEGLDWVIAGGESGPGARPCRGDDIFQIVHTCHRHGVPAFVKQAGRYPTGFERHRFTHPKGGDPSEWPEWMRVRQPARWRTVDEENGTNG